MKGIRILLDACMSPVCRDELVAMGYDVVWVGDIRGDLPDEEVLMLAHNEQRILVTQDKGFGRLAILLNQAHRGILRLVDFTAIEQASAIDRTLEIYAKELIQGGMVVAQSPSTFRTRP